MKALFLITTKGIPPLKEPHKWSSDLLDFFNKCIEKDVEKRPTSNDLLKVNIYIFFNIIFFFLLITQKSIHLLKEHAKEIN